MGNLGVSEVILVVFLVLIFFGSKKIPELAQGIGKGIREFRKATREDEDHDHTAVRQKSGNHDTNR